MQEGQEREHFASRIGFILVAAGCAIGIGAKSENLGEVEAFIDYVLEEKQP